MKKVSVPRIDLCAATHSPTGIVNLLLYSNYCDELNSDTVSDTETITNAVMEGSVYNVPNSGRNTYLSLVGQQDWKDIEVVLLVSVLRSCGEPTFEIDSIAGKLDILVI